MWISDAFAQTEGLMAAPAGSDPILSFMPFILILAVFWLLIWRPQMRKHKEHLDMVQSLRRGDRVITSGGIIGEVTKIIDDATIELKIAEGVTVKCARHHVTDMVDKGQPATKQDKKPAKKAK